MNKQALIDLRDKVKAGEETTVNDFEACFSEDHVDFAIGAEGGDFNAAMDFHEALLPGYFWNAASVGTCTVQRILDYPCGGTFLGNSKSHDPACALFLADLEALIAEAE